MATNQTSKPAEKKDHRQDLLDWIAKNHGMYNAVLADEALKTQKKQIEEAMMQGGMSAQQILHSQGIDMGSMNESIKKSIAPPQPMGQMNPDLGNIQAQGQGMPQQAPTQQQGQQGPGIMEILSMLIPGVAPARAASIGIQRAKLKMKQEGQQNLSPEQLGNLINSYNEQLPEGYQASYGAGGKIMASKPSSYATATSTENINSEVEGIAKGTVPPDPTRFVARRDITNVVGKLAAKGLDLKQLSLDYQAEQSFVKSINSTQQLRLRQLIPSVINGIDDLEQLNKDFKRTGIKNFNKATIGYYANGGGSKEQQQLAQKFVTQMTVLSDEMGSIFMGGNTPTERSLDLAMKLFNSEYNDTAVASSMEQVRRNLGYRANAIESVQSVGTKGLIGKGTISGGKHKETEDLTKMSDEELRKIAGIK